MTWRDDDWLLDRKARRSWMRSVALVSLVEMILRRPTTAHEALACLLDELAGDASPVAAPSEEAIAEEVARGRAWTRDRVATADKEGTKFQSMALLLPDSAPYRFELLLIDAPVRGDAAWTGAITWRSTDRFSAAVLNALLPSLGRLAEIDQQKADYALPLAYAAFFLRDVLRGRPGSALRRAVREAIVVYDGGDNLAVPLK